ncbi:MAG: fibronectin type III domain-containing protein [Bacteroidota bacterium]
MKNSKIRLDFAQLCWQFLIPFAMSVSGLFYLLTFVLVPPCTKIELDAAIHDLLTKGVASLTPGLGKVNLREDAYKIVVNYLRQLAHFAEMEYEGDGKKLLLTGFNIYSPESGSVPIIFNVIQGTFSGQVIANWPFDQNNHGYVLRYSINEVGLRDVYTEVNAGTTGWTLEGLTPLKEYMFSYCVVYSTYKGTFCDPVFLTVI